MRDDLGGSALKELVHLGWLGEGNAAKLMEQCLRGEHVLFVGPNKAARVKLAESLALDVGKIARVWTASDAAASRASMAGADYVFVPELSAIDLFELVTGEPALGVIASLNVLGPDNLMLALSQRCSMELLQNTLCKSMWRVGFDAQGKPRLVNEMGAETAKPTPTLTKTSSLNLPRSWEHETISNDPGWELDGGDA
jgi:hypothetical protein